MGPPSGMPMGLPPDPMALGAMPPPMMGPPPAPPAPLTAPLDLAVVIGQLSDGQLRGAVRGMDEEESFALIQAALGAGGRPLAERVVAAMEPSPSARKPPKDYRRPPKPDFAAASRFVAARKTRYDNLHKRILRDLAIYSGKLRGVFLRDRDNPQIEPWWDSTLHDDVDLVIEENASGPVNYRHRARHAAVREESQRCEDFVRLVREHNARRWVEHGNGNRRWAEARSVTLPGAICSVSVLDPDDEACPIRCDLWPIVEVLPQFGGRTGIRRAVRVFRAEVGDVIADYAVDGDLAEQVRDFVDPDGNRGTRQDDDVVEVWDYWDEGWHGAWLADGTVVLPPVEHKAWRCPVLYTRSPLGRDPSTTGVRLVRQGSNGGLRAVEASIEPDDDPEHCALGWVTARAEAHFQGESLLTRFADAASQIGAEPLIIKRGPAARASGPPPKIIRRTNVSNEISDDEEVQPIPATADPSTYAPLLETLGRMAATRNLPIARHGVTGNSQATGNAVSTMGATSEHKTAWVRQTLELHYAREARLWLELYRDGGHRVGPRGDRGRVTVPYARSRRRYGDADPTFVFEPQDVEAAGVDVEVSLVDPRRKNLAEIAAGALPFLQANVFDRYYVHEHLLNTEDPHEEIAAVSEDKLMMHPQVEEAKLLNDLLESAYLPDGTVDQGRYDLYRWVKQRLETSGPNAPPGPPGMGGGPPIGGGPPGRGMPMPMTTSGLDISQLNPAVGLGAGRPTGPGIGPPQLPTGFPPY